MPILEGKTALVTGASRNIGLEIARSLGMEGANVILCARQSAELEAAAAEIRKTGAAVLPIKADVSEPSQVEAMVKKGLEEYGKIDILVNNVGIRKKQFILDISYDDWDEVLRTNLSAAFYCAKAVAPGMIERKYGRIINISGRTGFEGQVDRAHIVASKAGLHGLTKGLAHDLALYGITVNTIAPGMIDTNRPVEMYPELKDIDKLRETIPVRRFGLKSEPASLVAFLVSEMAAYITGQVIHINGGLYMV